MGGCVLAGHTRGGVGGCVLAGHTRGRGGGLCIGWSH